MNAVIRYKRNFPKELKEERRELELKRAESVQKHKEEYEILEGKMEENRNASTKEMRAYLLDISEEGKALQKDNAGSDSTDSSEIKVNAVKEPVTYTKTGEVVPADQCASISVSV